MIKIRELEFEYFDRDEDGNLTDMINAIRGINFDAQKGQFIAIAGVNGSGKSTLARILNRLLVPIEGTVTIAGLDALDSDNETEIRKKVGMVFQNPDDQIVGTVVAEDVAFGAENIGVPENELMYRVMEGLEKAGLKATREFANRRINELSGGEKQKCAIAGVLAMKTECIVLDESTSMLDPVSRKELLDNMKKLNEELGITIILITHLMEELIYADYVYIMHMGRIVKRGRKEAIFADESELEKYGLTLPETVKIKNALVKKGIIKNINEFDLAAIADRVKKEHPKSFYLDVTMPEPHVQKKKINPRNAILFDGVSGGYGKKNIIEDVSFGIEKGEYVCVIGRTGSGKSTLLQHVPGLLKAKRGTVYVDGLDVSDRTTDIRKLRCKIGYVFQNPDRQLFAKNVYEDVVFGPRNVGISEVEAEKRAYESISLVGLSEDIYDMPITHISGGQKKRVALAGVLAMKPEYLILDEPLAGLDPAGKEDMLKIIDILHKDAGITIVMVTHEVDMVASHADRIIALDGGRLIADGKPEEVFYSMALNEETYDAVPAVMQLLVRLRALGMPVECDTLDINEAVEGIGRLIQA